MGEFNDFTIEHLGDSFIIRDGLRGEVMVMRPDRESAEKWIADVLRRARGEE